MYLTDEEKTLTESFIILVEILVRLPFQRYRKVTKTDDPIFFMSAYLQL